MRFVMWAPLGLTTLILLTGLQATPITTDNPGTGKPSTVGLLEEHLTHAPTTGPSTVSSILREVSGMTTETTGKPTTQTTGKPTTEKHTALLNQQMGLTQRLRGRVVLANTRIEGSDEWGVDADQAEIACNRIARYQSETGDLSTSLLSDFLQQFFSGGMWQQKPKRMGTQPMQGHLLSIGSSYEVMALSRLLSPLPDGAYWTGGKLVRYRVNNMRRPTSTDHVVLTWNDGRVGRPSILGLTRADEEQLREGYTYCLALNLKEATWQARDCSDRLPYACLITPRQTGFTNKVPLVPQFGESTEVPEMTAATTEEDLSQTTADLLAGEMATSQPMSTTPTTQNVNTLTPLTTGAVSTQSLTTETGATPSTASGMTESTYPSAGATDKTTPVSYPPSVKAAVADFDGDVYHTEDDDDNDDDDFKRSEKPTTLDSTIRETTKSPKTVGVLSGVAYQTTGMPTTAKVLSGVAYETTGIPTTATAVNVVKHETTGMPTTNKLLWGVAHHTTGMPTTARVMSGVAHHTTGMPKTTAKLLSGVSYETTGMPTTAKMLNAVAHETTGMPTTAKVLGSVAHQTTGLPTTARVLDEETVDNEAF